VETLVELIQSHLLAATIALPVDFEEAADAYEIAGFDGGVASVEAGPDGAVSLKYVKGAGANWAGVWINLDTAVDAANGEIVTADVHSTVARDITLKFDAANVERVVSHGGTGWESLSYDFTGAMPADQTKIAFFNDLSQQGDGSADWTIHIDNLAQSTGGDTGGTDPEPPVSATIALPVDFEEAADAYEIAGFDGGVASVEAGPDGAVSLKYVKGAGANWAGVWINLDTAVDAANGEVMTAAVHSTVARDITLKFDAANVERVASHTGSGWEALSYDFTGAMPAGQTKIAFFNDLSQQGDGTDAWTIYIDNLAQASGGDTGGGDTGGTDNGPKDVTFSVDMTGVDLTDGNPTLQSTFNGWCGGCNPMSDDDGDNIWTITVNIPQGDHEYKYALGAWVSQESVPADCDNTLGANRAVTVTGDVTLATDVYSGCPGDDTSGGTDPDPVASTTYCATPVKHFLIDAEVASEVALTVERVDANTVDVSVVSTDADPVDLVLVGAQSGDAAGVSAMDLQNGTATVTLTWANGAPDTTSFEVLWSKESNGGNWMLRKEDLPSINTAATCETGGDTGGTDPEPPVSATIALPVDFEEAADAYEIAGFDGGVASVEAGPDGAVSLKYVKGAGANWAGVWINLDTAVDAANGEIVTADVHSTVARDITLKFDAANVERVVSHGGTGWESLSYDFTGAMPADQTKIAFFNDLSQQGDGSADWTIHIDNLAQSTGGDTGGTDPEPPVSATIALPVDFEEAADAYEIAGFDGGVASVEAGPDGAVSLKYVKGAGANWAGVWINLDTAVDAANGEVMTAAVHSTVARDITLKFDAANVERVASHTGSGWEALSYDFTGAMPAGQTKIAFFNDLSQQGDGTDAWTIYIDNLAQASGGDTGGGDTGGTDNGPKDVTFSVDMTGVDLTDGNPTLQSTFNSWCGGCNPMSDDDGDNIWTITVNIPQGDHEYKYALGAWVSQESVPADCDNTLGANRAVTVTGDVTLATDVYSGCPGDDTSGGD
jgi:hypothetical protein